MPDIFDEIIDRLPPSTIRLILNFKNDHQDRCMNVSNLLHTFQQIKIRQINQELKRKIFDIKSKTAENMNFLYKLRKELEVLKCLKKTPGNEQSLKAYSLKINELESKVKTITEAQGDIDLAQLFNEVEELNQQIEKYKKKISEVKSKYQHYDNFPPDKEQAKEAIAKLREKIKQHETVVESFFQL